MALLERDPPLALLAEFAEEARRGEGRLVLVSGEAGVGKSALLAQSEQGIGPSRWAWGACDGLSTPRPLGPLFDLSAHLGGQLLELCRNGADRGALFDALLRQISQPGDLTVVVIEDLHWADEATLDLLRFLGRRVRGTSALLVFTYRDDGLAPADPLRLALGDLASQDSTKRIALAPLSTETVHQMATASGLEPLELYRLTGGNPFYVTEVIAAGTGGIPPSARDAVWARVARLTSGSRQVLEAAALLGARIEPRLLVSATACDPETLDELLGSGLLIEDGAWLRFRHEIARLAVEETLATHRRAVVHTRILASLQSFDSSDDARMAFHAEGAADGPAVVEHGARAARRAAELGSHREAAAQYARALRFADVGDPAAVADLYAGLATESALVDRWQEASDAYGRALTLWREVGDRLREGDTMRHISRAMENLCRGAEQLAAIQTAVQILEPLGPTKELAEAYAALACAHLLHAEQNAATEWAQRAQAIAERLNAFDVLSDALNTEACALSFSTDDWVGPAQRSLDIALEHGFPAQAGRAYANLYGTLCDQRRYAEAEPFFVDGMAYCDEHEIGTYSTFLWSTRTTVLLETGRWDEALDVSTDLLEHGDTSPINRICPTSQIETIRARRGELGTWEGLDEALAAAEGANQPQYVVPVRLLRAEGYWLEGDIVAARFEAESADDLARDADAWLRGDVAVWLRRTGSTRAVQGGLAEPFRLLLDGDHCGAARFWSNIGCSFNAAMALSDTDDEAALREALAIFEGLGALATARMTRQKLRHLGARSIPVGPRSATRADPSGLTSRERQVLDLICEGDTNAEIGRALFISTKTVDHHVSAVLAKLGTPNRSAAAAEAARLGLAVAAAR
jgi:DNA-binding CsgD family transcriptional regulator/tetratricopeptide (TPR) repeat protein